MPEPDLLDQSALFIFFGAHDSQALDRHSFV